MKRIVFTKKETTTLQVRNQKEQLIAEIVEATSEPNKKALAKLLALRANEMRWTETDLHALLKKKTDPNIRNFTAYVKWSIKTKTT